MPRALEQESQACSAKVAEGRLEVRLSGSGGQGIILAATLLADACAQAGKQVVQTQSYGPEARGGASKAEVVIADEEIDYPEVRRPDVTLCLSQAAFDKYAHQAPAASRLYYDSGLVVPAAVAGVSLIGGPFTELASSQLGKPVVTNIIALAATAADARLVDTDGLRAALERRLPARLLELNLQAFALGLCCELDRHLSA